MNLQNENPLRRELLKIFSEALPSVNGQRCVADYLREHPPAGTSIRVIAIGKAAASMLAGVQSVCAERIKAALLITKYHHLDDVISTGVPLVTIEAGHPYPDANSLLAGRQLLDFLAQSRAEDTLLFLVSGGASALVEVLPDSVTLQQLEDMNRWLLARGWPIDKMNQLRKAVSCIKGGRLARYLGKYPVTQLMISDVPGDDPPVIGSGLLLAQPHAAGLPETLPDWIQDMLAKAPPMPAQGDTCFERIETALVASNRMLRDEACRLAEGRGLVVRCNEAVTGDAAEQGQMIAAQLKDGPAGLYVWGGETVVTLPATPGRGGRCQHLALAAARELAGCDKIALLAAGTDGSDGPGEVAGALIDGGSIQRGRDAGKDPGAALLLADAGSFLHASGDLLDTGPTGTNVMDLILGLKY